MVADLVACAPFAKIGKIIRYTAPEINGENPTRSLGISLLKVYKSGIFGKAKIRLHTLAR